MVEESCQHTPVLCAVCLALLLAQGHGLPLATAGLKGGTNRLSLQVPKLALCPKTRFRIGEKVVHSYDDLLKFFSYYSLIPRIDNREMVAVAVELPKPCGAFSSNVTLYMRASTKDVRAFKDVFQHGLLQAATSLFNKTQPQRILDLGAHTGMSTALLAMRFPGAQIAAVEPDMSNFALLRLNTAPHPQVKHLEYGAAWDHSATVRFGRDGHGRSLWQRFVVDVVELTTGRIGELVPAVTVSGLMEKYAWPNIDLVVSDMEGAERVVVTDASAKQWLARTKCLAIRQYDSNPAPLQRMLTTMTPRFTRRASYRGLNVWCQASAQDL